MFRKPITWLAALAVGALALVGLAGSGVLSPASAAPVRAAASPVLSTTERGLCIREGTGAPQSLWLVEATGKCPAGFWGPASLNDAFGIDLSALVKAEVAKQVTATPAKAPAPVVDDADETAPVLSISGAAGAHLVNVKWTVPGAAADEKIGTYVLQYRLHDAVKWTERTGITLPKASVGPTSPALIDDTSYDFRVRAEYVSGGNGPWSSVLTVKTAEAA